MLKIMTMVLMMVFAAGANAQTRRAFIIGNDTYPGNQLQNARNDAKAVNESLLSAGYASTLVLDATRAGISSELDGFVETLNPGDTAVLYYAGHGFQLEGENYLVPIDFQMSSPVEAKQQGYALSSILDRFTSHGATTQIVILDACRDNPFLGTRSVRGGWAGLGTSAGAFLAFGTSPGSTASDDPSEGHGLFTKDLLKYLTASNQDIEEMFRKVREDVIRDSKGKQVPWIASSLIGSFHVRQELDMNAEKAYPVEQGNSKGEALANRSIGSLAVSKGLRLEIDEQVQLSRAVELVRGWKLQAAASALENLLSVYPGCLIAFRILGLVYHGMGRDLDSVKVLNTAIALNSADTTASVYRCAIERLKDLPAASSDCESVVSDVRVPKP